MARSDAPPPFCFARRPDSRRETRGQAKRSCGGQMPYRFNIGVYGTEGSIRNGELFAPPPLLSCESKKGGPGRPLSFLPAAPTRVGRRGGRRSKKGGRFPASCRRVLPPQLLAKQERGLMSPIIHLQVKYRISLIASLTTSDPRRFASPAAPTRVGRRGGRRNEAAGEDAAQTHKVCFAADLSAESGSPVAISELDNM
jgi:hypothetical protein